MNPRNERTSPNTLGAHRARAAAGTHPGRARTTRRGAALLLAVFATMVVGTTTLAYVASRDTSVGVARNAQLSADARALAGAGMDLTKNILRSSDTSWRTNHSSGTLLSNYSLDGGTITVRLADLVKRAAGNANPVPDATSTQIEVTVTSQRNGASWTSVSHQSIPSVARGQYVLFAKQVLALEGSSNFIGRWPAAPQSSQLLRLNLGTLATTSNPNNSSAWQGTGVFLRNGTSVESQVAGSIPSDPDTAKSTWAYYPYNGTSAVIGGQNASLVAAKQLSQSESVAMVAAPTAPSCSGSFTTYTSTQVLNGVTQTVNPFRIRATFLPQLFTRNWEVRSNSTVTMNAGTYEIWGSWIMRDSRIIINGDVRIQVNPNLALTGLDWQNSSVEINANSSLEIYDGYSMTLQNCWIGPRVQCLTEPNAALRDGDPHKKLWFNQWVANQCFNTIPSHPQYIEPWRVKIYPMPQFLSSYFTWDITDSCIVGSLYLPTNPIRLYGRTRVYGRIAANAICLFGTSSVYYDHALDLVTGLTEGATPSRGGDPTTMFPLRMVSYGFDAENAR
ncbi:MAG: hypothetical protein U0625_06380 [Phycisphaerales bacterium]